MSQDLSRKKELQILKDILDSKEAFYIYRIPSVYKVRVEDVYTFLEKYKKWLVVKDGKVAVFSYSESAVRAALEGDKVDSIEKDKRHIPLTFLGEKRGLDEFYLPVGLLLKDRTN